MQSSEGRSALGLGVVIAIAIAFFGALAVAAGALVLLVVRPTADPVPETRPVALTPPPAPVEPAAPVPIAPAPLPIAPGLHGDLRVPRVMADGLDVRGSLPPEVIRGVVRRHINEVRFCYEQELRDHPSLAGRVVVSFIIAPSGEVQSAALSSSTLGNERVEGCIVQAVRRWTFPAPDGGGVVGVSYPFELSTSGSAPIEQIAAPPEGAPPNEQGLAAARRCMANGDNACVIRALEGRAQTEQEIAMLIESYRARGQTQEAARYMRIYVERFPSSPRARNYQQILSRHGD